MNMIILTMGHHPRKQQGGNNRACPKKILTVAHFKKMLTIVDESQTNIERNGSMASQIATNRTGSNHLEDVINTAKMGMTMMSIHIHAAVVNIVIVIEIEEMTSLEKVLGNISMIRIITRRELRQVIVDAVLLKRRRIIKSNQKFERKGMQ